MSMVIGTAGDTLDAIGWIQATTGFAKGLEKSLTKIWLAPHSSVPSAYLKRTNSLNHTVIVKLDNVVQDRIKFEEAIDILHDMTNLMILIRNKIFDKEAN